MNKVTFRRMLLECFSHGMCFRSNDGWVDVRKWRDSALACKYLRSYQKNGLSLIDEKLSSIRFKLTMISWWIAHSKDFLSQAYIIRLRNRMSEEKACLSLVRRSSLNLYRLMRGPTQRSDFQFLYLRWSCFSNFWEISRARKKKRGQSVRSEKRKQVI